MTLKHAEITGEMLERARSRIGQVYVPREPFFNVAATRDTIRHFVNGIGDLNPLFRDEGYARRTRYGRIVAPPCFLYSVYTATAHGASMPGIHAWHSGNDWEWFLPIREGDEFTVTVTLLDVREKRSQMSGRSVIGYDEAVYTNQRGQIVSKARGWAVRAERGASGEKGKYRRIERASYTPEELAKINADIDAEVVRGAEPRFWEDVVVGEELAPVVKGPLSVRDINTWLMGWGSPYMRAHKIQREYEKRHPAIGMINSRTGQVDVPELVHMEDSRAQELGIPGAYDYGPQRMSWMGQLLTNWAGDEGFIKRMYGELRLFNVVGDTTWVRGRVTRKYVEESEHLVEIECRGINQRGDVTMPGWAVVALPSRERGAWPLEGRLD